MEAKVKAIVVAKPEMRAGEIVQRVAPLLLKESSVSDAKRTWKSRRLKLSRAGQEGDKGQADAPLAGQSRVLQTLADQSMRLVEVLTVDTAYNCKISVIANEIGSNGQNLV